MLSALPIIAPEKFNPSLFVTSISSLANTKLDDSIKSKRSVIAYSREKGQLLIGTQDDISRSSFLGGNTTTKEFRSALAFAAADKYLSQPVQRIICA